MFLDRENKQKIRHQALLEAIRLCGGVTAFSKCLKVNRSRASNWCNRPEIEIPYEYAVLIAHITQVSIARLSPFTKTTNEVIKQLRYGHQSQLVKIALNEILAEASCNLRRLKRDRPMIIGTDRVLISGLLQFEHCRALGNRQSLVMVLDLESLLLGQKMLQDMQLDLLTSEEIEIGLSLERLLGSFQGQKRDFTKNNTAFFPMRGGFKGCTDIRIAQMIGYSTNTYYRAKQVYLQGSVELIGAVDRKEISVAVAVEKLNKTKSLEPNEI